MAEYWHRVETDGAKQKLYDGTDNAAAMAAWSEAISSGVEYVTLESLLRPGQPKVAGDE